MLLSSYLIYNNLLIYATLALTLEEELEDVVPVLVVQQGVQTRQQHPQHPDSS